MQSLNLKLITCSVLYREMCSLIATSIHKVDMEVLPKGLHDLETSDMVSRLQERVDQASSQDYDRILLGYALCNNGVVGLTAKDVPLVIPKAHDCITLFLGDCKRYQTYFDDNPGVYFHTTGWLERGDEGDELTQYTIAHKTGMDKSLDELIAEYGEDNGQYIYDMLCATTKNYGKFAFIEMGVEPDDRFEQQSRTQARERGWEFEKLQGDMQLLKGLIDGPWDSDQYLVVPPQYKIVQAYDERVIKVIPCQDA